VAKRWRQPTSEYAKPPAPRIDSVEVFLGASTPAYLATIDSLLAVIAQTGVYGGYVSLRFTQPTTAFLGMEQATQPRSSRGRSSSVRRR
jgi:hypothetical protein